MSFLRLGLYREADIPKDAAHRSSPFEGIGEFVFSLSDDRKRMCVYLTMDEIRLRGLAESEEEAFAKAEENTFREPVVSELTAYMDLICMKNPQAGERLPAPDDYAERDGDLYIVTGEDMLFGSSQILNPAVLERLKETVGSDLIAIPSSVHEMLIMRADGMEQEEADDMVNEINGMMVKPKDRLSDRVYMLHL